MTRDMTSTWRSFLRLDLTVCLVALNVRKTRPDCCDWPHRKQLLLSTSNVSASPCYLRPCMTHLSCSGTNRRPRYDTRLIRQYPVLFLFLLTLNIYEIPDDCVRACVRACVSACVSASVRASVRACVLYTYSVPWFCIKIYTCFIEELFIYVLD